MMGEIGEDHCDPLAQAECAYIAIHFSFKVCDSLSSRVLTLML